MASASPTERSLKKLRDEGWSPWVVERWGVRAAGGKRNGRTLFYLERRHDLWTFGDIMAVQEGERPLICQTTSYSGVSARVKKIVEVPEAKVWIANGDSIVVHGWHKPKHRWVCREVFITPEHFEE